MYRFVAVAVALLAVACSDQNRKSTMDAMNNAADSAKSMAQSTGAAAGGAIDSAGARMSAMADSATAKLGSAADSATAFAGKAYDSATSKVSAAVDSSKRVASSAAGSLAPSGNATSPAKLSKDQLTQLQTALNNDGCSAGIPDGIIGAKTKQAIACGMKKHNISADDYQSLYQALNLTF